MNVTGDRTQPHGLATIGYDDDGVAGQRWDIVSSGRFVGYQLDRVFARRLGVPRSNGCAYADSPEHTPIQRMANVSLAADPNGGATADLIAGIEDGIYVVGDKSWSIDMQRYNFQFTGQRFYRISGGQLAGQLRDVAYQATTTDFWNAHGRSRWTRDMAAGRSFQLWQGSARTGRRRFSRLPERAVPWHQRAEHRRGVGPVTRSGGSDAMAAQLTPQQLVETALAASRTDGCVVVVTSQTTANIRWANNTVTTSGATSEWSWFVVAIAGRAAGTAASTSTDPADIENVLRAAEQAARDAGPAEDAMELVGGHASDAFEMVAAESDFGVYDRLIPSLAVAFGAARAEEQILYGFARHELATTYLGTSTGIRERWVQPTGTLEINAKSADLTRSAWAGLSTDDFTDVDPAAVGASLAERLNWAGRTVALPAGRYDTVLPPSSVADLMIYLAWTASGRAAHEGRSPFSAPGGGTRIGERLGALPLSLFSDPAAYPIQAAPFVAAASSSDETSVFDNGAPIGRTTLLDRGILSGLIHTRSSAARFGEPFAPAGGQSGAGRWRRAAQRHRPGGRRRAWPAADLAVVHPVRRSDDPVAHRADPGRCLSGRGWRDRRRGEQLPVQHVAAGRAAAGDGRVPGGAVVVPGMGGLVHPDPHTGAAGWRISICRPISQAQ